MHIIVFASLELVSWLLVLSTILVFGMFNLQKVSILLILNLSFIFVFDLIFKLVEFFTHSLLIKEPWIFPLLFLVLNLVLSSTGFEELHLGKTTFLKLM